MAPMLGNLSVIFTNCHRAYQQEVMSGNVLDGSQPRWLELVPPEERQSWLATLQRDDLRQTQAKPQRPFSDSYSSGSASQLKRRRDANARQPVGPAAKRGRGEIDILIVCLSHIMLLRYRLTLCAWAARVGDVDDDAGADSKTQDPSKPIGSGIKRSLTSAIDRVITRKAQELKSLPQPMDLDVPSAGMRVTRLMCCCSGCHPHTSLCALRSQLKLLQSCRAPTYRSCMTSSCCKTCRIVCVQTLTI